MQKTRKITLYENKTQLIISAIDKIVVEIFNKKENDKQAQSILLTGCSALTGTTSTCIGLAIAVANTQRKTLLIDCDMRKIVKYKKLNEQATTGLSDFLSQEHLQEIMKPEEVFYETNIENLTYIPCGAKTDNPTRLLCSTKMEELLKVANENYDCIIVESFGVGGIPKSIADEFYRLCRQYPDKLVVMATQVAHEGSDMTVYEVGHDMKKYCRFLESYDMTLESVIAKTMWMLGNFDLHSIDVEDIFYRSINYDVIFGKNRKC